MRYLRIGIILCLLSISFSNTLWAQSTLSFRLQAKVYDNNMHPIKGAIVQSREHDDVKSITDANGVFSIIVSPSEELSIGANGYVTKYLAASTLLKEIKLNNIDADTVQVSIAFRKEDKKNLFGDVSVVNVKSLLKKNYFTYSLDGMEAFVPGYNGNSNWGMGSYLTLVDNVPRDANNVLPTEIDQISFLKGVGAIALYGSTAAKGVISITTKRGEAYNRRIDIRTNMGTFVPISYPKYLGSAEYMKYYNQARENDSLPDLYDQNTIYNYASGENPYRYPNVDFYSSNYLKNAYNRYDATAEISGGNDKAKYYTNIGFYTVGSLLDFGEAKNERTNRFNFRANVDIKLNEYLTATIDASATFYNGKGVNTDYWNNAAIVRPNRFSPLIPISMIEPNDESSMLYVKNSNYVIDGKYLLGGTQLDQTNPFASIYAGGTNQYISRQFQFNSGINADLRNVLKGLKFKSNIAVDYSTSYNLAYNYSYATYEPTWNDYSGTDLISSLTKYGNDATSGTQNVSNSWYKQTIAFYGLFSYDRTFNEKNNFSGMLLANGYQQSESAVYHRVSNANLGFHAGYNYDHKYYVDFNSAYIHSAKLPVNHREALSPTVSLAWRISNENFLKNASDIINDLKITASAGIVNTDLDISDYYLYQGYYTVAGSWFGWKDGSGFQATESRRGENANMRFPKRKEINIGFDGQFLKRALEVTGNFFVNEIQGNIIQASTLFPNYFTTSYPVSSFIPYINYNTDERIGFDFGLNLKEQIGKLGLNLGVNGTYYNTKAIKRAEIYADDYQYHQGKPLDGIWGLQSLGFFNSQEDINNSPKQSFGEVHPGDIKYKDQNGDGVINTQDEVYLGKGGWYGSPYTFGINLTATWKKFTLFAYGIGRYGAYGVKNNSYFWNYGDSKYSEVVRGSWTEATKNTATYPRLTTNSSDNNFQTSDFWMYKTDRFDIAKVQLSYDLTGLLKRKQVIRELNVYVSGSNLLTISPEKDILNMNIGAAPQTRFYNIGIKALF